VEMEEGPSVTSIKPSPVSPSNSMVGRFVRAFVCFIVYVEPTVSVCGHVATKFGWVQLEESKDGLFYMMYLPSTQIVNLQ